MLSYCRRYNPEVPQLSLDELVRMIEQVETSQPVKLVAIDGPAGSGKTTLAAKLAEKLGASVVQIDDFIGVSDIESWWPRFERDILVPMFERCDLHYQIRDWVNDLTGTSFGPWQLTPWTPTMIIEGVGASRRAVAQRLSFAIYVEAPADLRLKRGLERDFGVEDAEGIWTRWLPLEAEFFAHDGARSRAHVLVNGVTGVIESLGKNLEPQSMVETDNHEQDPSDARRP